VLVKMTAFFGVSIALLSGALLLVSVWIQQVAYVEVRRFFPAQFSDVNSAPYYFQYVLFDRTAPARIKRQVAISIGLLIVAILGFAAVTYLASHRVLATLLSLIFVFCVANTGRQWVRAQLSSANAREPK
jgi:hypothetical protein